MTAQCGGGCSWGCCSCYWHCYLLDVTANWRSFSQIPSIHIQSIFYNIMRPNVHTLKSK